jgi:proliferating cell nuclear antigen
MNISDRTHYNENDSVLLIKTIQVQAIRVLFTTLKDILCDATITFTNRGIKILNMDKNRTILVNLHLYSDKFQIYKCTEEKIIICVNVSYLNKLISMSNDDVLSIYIDKNSYNDGIVTELGLQYENSKKKQITCHQLRLIDPDTEEYNIPDLQYSSIINLPTSDFQKIIRDLNAIADRVEIKSVGNEFIFSVNGTYAKSYISRSSSDENMSFIQKPDDSVVIQGIFSLKSLMNITKCTQLCANLEIYLGNDLPLTIKYEVADLGEISLSIIPLSASSL